MTTKILTFEEQKQICAEFLNSPAGIAKQKMDFDSFVEDDSIIVDGHFEMVNHLDYVMNMEMDDEYRSFLCQKLKDMMNEVSFDSVDWEQDYYEFVESVDGQGSAIFLDNVVIDVIPVSENKLSTLFYYNIDVYAEKHDMYVNDVKIDLSDK